MEVSALNEVAEVELIYKSNVKASKRPEITSARIAKHRPLKVEGSKWCLEGCNLFRFLGFRNLAQAYNH